MSNTAIPCGPTRLRARCKPLHPGYDHRPDVEEEWNICDTCGQFGVVRMVFPLTALAPAPSVPLAGEALPELSP